MKCWFKSLNKGFESILKLDSSKLLANEISLISVGSVETRAVVNAARNSFTRLFDRLGRYYEALTIRPDVGFRERNSLVRMLGRGLNRVLKNKSGLHQGPSTPQVYMITEYYWLGFLLTSDYLYSLAKAFILVY